MKLKQVSTILVLCVSGIALASCTGSTPNRMSARSALTDPAVAPLAMAPHNGSTAHQRANEYFGEAKYGVKASPRVAYGRSRLKRGGGREQVGKPYQIRGKWYYPKEEPGYVKSGAASWYGDAFHGRLTANGEIYDMTHLSAAHPTMPLPSYARVTNTKNGASVIVRVNDRGPYAQGRVIDLSRRAAEMLGYVQDGTAKVKVEYVGRAPLDGQDDQYLIASYQPGSMTDPSVGMPSGVLVAMNGGTPGQAQRSVQAFPGEMTTSTEPEEAAVAAASYASVPARSGAVGALDQLADGEGVYVLVGAFADRSEAVRLSKILRGFGSATIKTSRDTAGRRWHNLSIHSNAGADGDALLRAAWAAGATDAMTVRN